MGKKFKPLFYVHILNKILYKAMKDLVPDFFFNYSSLVLYTTQAKESGAFHAPWRAPHNQRALIPHSAETSLTGHSSTLSYLSVAFLSSQCALWLMSSSSSFHEGRTVRVVSCTYP